MNSHFIILVVFLLILLKFSELTSNIKVIYDSMKTQTFSSIVFE